MKEFEFKSVNLQSFFLFSYHIFQSSTKHNQEESTVVCAEEVFHQLHMGNNSFFRSLQCRDSGITKSHKICS